MQLGIVWESCLRFYVSVADASDEAGLVRGWEQAVAEGHGEGRGILQVRGHTGIGRDGLGGPDNPSALTWYESGLQLQLIWPDHSLGDAVELAEAMEYVK